MVILSRQASISVKCKYFLSIYACLCASISLRSLSLRIVRGFSKQLKFIDDLRGERQAEDWILDDPETIEEASHLIGCLLERPYR